MKSIVSRLLPKVKTVAPGIALSLGLAVTGTQSATAVTPVSVPAVIPTNTVSSTLPAIDSAGTLWNYSAPGTSRLSARSQVSHGWQDAKQILSVDWNNDGQMDILSRRADGRLLLQTGMANNEYRNPVQIGNGWQTFDIIATKLKRSDDYPGLVARNTVDEKLYYYPNRFGSSLSPRLMIGTGGWATMSELTALDFDRDGAMDIVARNSVGGLYLYRTNGMGSFVSEARKQVGNGWKPMTSISVKTDFAGPGTTGLLARNSRGQLYYYPVTVNRINAGKLVGNGWNGYTIAEGVASAAPVAARRGVYETTYSKTVYNYVKKWCPQANVILNHSSVISGNVYGMTWWGSPNLAIRTDIPESITKDIALHECGHLLQGKAFGINGFNAAISRLNVIYGDTGRGGIEQSADCIAVYLSPYSAPASLGASSQKSLWDTRCTGYKGTAAKLIVQGKRP